MSAALLGIGNVLCGDDAIGPYVVSLVDARWELPRTLVLDAGTPGLDLVTFLAGRRAVVLVDSVRAEAAPGSVRVYQKDEILRQVPGARQGVHEPALRDTLSALELAGEAPRALVLVGVVPATVSTGAGLSPPVRAAAQRAVVEVLRQCAALGIVPRRRRPPARPAIWWESAPPGTF